MASPNWMTTLRRRMAAGLEISVLGSLLSVVLLLLLAKMSGMPWHSYGNLFATGLYPDTVLDELAGYWTATGFALVFLYFTLAGILFALLFWARRTGIGPHLVGVTYALALFLLGDRYWWQLVSPYIIIYGVQAHLMWTHVLFGVVLGLLPRRLSRYNPPDSTAQSRNSDDNSLLHDPTWG